MAVAAGLGVHIGGRVNGTEVCGDWELAVGLPQAERNIIHKNRARELFFCKRSHPLEDNYLSIANLNAQNARMMVMGANTKFSKETPDARFPKVFNIKYAKTIHIPILTTPENLPDLI